MGENQRTSRPRKFFLFFVEESSDLSNDTEGTFPEFLPPFVPYPHTISCFNQFRLRIGCLPFGKYTGVRNMYKKEGMFWLNSLIKHQF